MFTVDKLVLLLQKHNILVKRNLQERLFYNRVRCNLRIMVSVYRFVESLFCVSLFQHKDTIGILFSTPGGARVPIACHPTIEGQEIIELPIGKQISVINDLVSYLFVGIDERNDAIQCRYRNLHC